jgi:hypothetical protein
LKVALAVLINAASSGGSQYPFLIASFPTTISSTL